jgi:thiamine kinase-like enzyme
MNAGFVVGPIVAPFYFKERHLHTPSNRGPYLTSQEYMREKIDLESSYKSDEIELFKSTRVEEVLDELDEDYLEDGDSILDLCKGYLEALPTIFPAQDSLAEGPFVPCHEDLNQGNILVDPETFAITGIIDWEMISIVPLWQARSFPKTIRRHRSCRLRYVR